MQFKGNKFPLFIDEVSSPVANHGCLFIYLALDETSRSGNDASNSAKYISKKFVVSQVRTIFF